MPASNPLKNNTLLAFFKKIKLPLFFWLGLLIWGLALWAGHSLLLFQNQSKVTQTAELSVNGFASFVGDYIEKHKVLVKSVVNHHQVRIVELAKGGGYPYDFHEIESEIRSLFPSETEFAIINKDGEAVLGSHPRTKQSKCQTLIKHNMQQGLNDISRVKSHLSPEGEYHFDILYKVFNGEDYAALWVKLSFKPLETFIKNLNIEEYDLVISEITPPNNILIGSVPMKRVASEQLNFDFISNQAAGDAELRSKTLALAPIRDVPWQVRALVKSSALDALSQRLSIIFIVIFSVGALVAFAILLFSRQLQSEREKLKQDAEHDQLFNAGPTVLLDKSADRNMLIRYASPNIENMFSLTVAELTNQPYLKWIYKDDIEEVRTQLIQAYSEQKDKVEMIYRVLSNDNGGFKWIYDFTHIKYNRMGKPEALRGYITSIHAQKMAEKNATDLIQSVPEAIFVTQVNGQVININTAAEQFISGSREELLNANFSDWITDSALQEYLRLRQEYLTKQTFTSIVDASEMTLEMRNLLGKTFAVDISLKQIELNGELLLIQVVRDITLQVKVKEQLRAAKEEAEALARARSRFVATISHEIRTPMNGVLGMADLLSGTELTSAQQKYLQAIKDSGATLLQIINEVLDFAKLDEGRISLNEQPINLKEIIHESTHLLSVQAEEKNLALDIEYADDVKQAFIGDELRIKQLLMNLVSNAIKFTPYGRVTVSVEQQNDLVGSYSAMLIRVQDTGIGIEKANQSKLFDSFTQADDSTSRQFGGTGLGLAISKQLVELMQGQIGVTSEAGMGSEFWVRLPLKVPQNPAVKKPAPALSEQKIVNDYSDIHEKTVLVVEDNLINQNVIKAFLERMDLKVDIAENGLQGVDYWRMHPSKYDLILMDCQMPVMDGFEATQIIRNEEKHLMNNHSIPIIALTANVIEEGKERCMEVGMNDFIAKPIERLSFEERLLKWLK